MTDSDHIVQLRQQVSNLHARLNRIMEGLEGSCMTCEPIGVRNQQMEQHIKKLQAERDEARRQVCELLVEGGCVTVEQIARERGWDCFKDKP